MKVIKQLFTTFYQSLGYLKRGNIIGAYYWFYVRNCVSLCGNKVHRFTEGNDKKSLVQIQRGFHELPKLQKVNARLLKDLFLDSTGFAGSSMDDYFNECRLLGYVRPNGIDISESPILKIVLNDLGIVSLVQQYLNLPLGKISFNAKIDALISIDGNRKFVNGYDDALAFHRDIDSLSFVKAFVYLTDVFEGYGHHEVCLDSNRNLPFKLRLINRQPHSEVRDYELLKIFGHSGFAWIEDTTNFHRGTIPHAGDRLILSMSFNDSRSVSRLDDGIYYSLKETLEF